MSTKISPNPIICQECGAINEEATLAKKMSIEQVRILQREIEELGEFFAHCKEKFKDNAATLSKTYEYLNANQKLHVQYRVLAKESGFYRQELMSHILLWCKLAETDKQIKQLELSGESGQKINRCLNCQQRLEDYNYKRYVELTEKGQTLHQLLVQDHIKREFCQRIEKQAQVIEGAQKEIKNYLEKLEELQTIYLSKLQKQVPYDYYAKIKANKYFMY